MESKQGYLSRIRERLRAYLEKYRERRREYQIDMLARSACVDFPKNEEEDKRIRKDLRKIIAGEEFKK